MDKNYCILLDTNFLINLLGGKQKPLHKNARYYYEHCLKLGNILKVSTISVAEYCVRASAEDILYQNVQILPFNINHAERAGEFANIIYNHRRQAEDKIEPRKVIANDTKLFAQADVEKNITHFLTGDRDCKKVFKILNDHTTLDFKFVDLTQDPKLFFKTPSELF